MALQPLFVGGGCNWVLTSVPPQPMTSNKFSRPNLKR